MGHEWDQSKGSCDPANTATGTVGTPGTVETPGTVGTLDGAPRLPGYVVRTDILKRGTRAFINICGDERIGVPFYRDVQLWTVPHGLSGPKEDPAAGRRPDKCKVYDFVVHPNTLRMVGASVAFKRAVNDLAVEGVSKQFNIRLDKKNLAFPDMTYKGAGTNGSYVEKLVQVSLERCGNELNEFYNNESYKEIIYLNEETEKDLNCLEDTKSSNLKCNEMEPGKNDEHQINGHVSVTKLNGYEEKSDHELNVNLKEIPSTKKTMENPLDVLSINAFNAAEISENLSCIKDEASRWILPEYKSFQDQVSLTFIFDASKVDGEKVFLNVKSSQEILLKMTTSVESGSPLRYQCCLKFGNKSRFMENGCHIDISETNVVLAITKAERSFGTWHSYFIGTSFQHLDVRDFTTVDNLKRDLDALDMGDASPAGNCPGDEKFTKDTKAEEKELEDVPGEIVVVHERGIPRLHGILKQRSMSESSDDVSIWSYSMDRLASTATASDSESEEYEGSPGHFRPCFKKSVSFSEQIDEAMFIVNQSVSQMHHTLKNKRRRMRKREQKHGLKEARRRVQSCSESFTTRDDQDFLHHGMALSPENHQEFVYGGKPAWNPTKRVRDDDAAGGTDSTEFQDSGSESAALADEDCAKKNADDDDDVEESAVDEDLGDDEASKPSMRDVENIGKNLEETRGSGWEVFLEKTSLETCGRTNNGGVAGLVGGKETTDLDGVIGGNMGMLSYIAETRTSGDADVTVLPCGESVFNCEWTSSEKKTNGISVDFDHSAFELRDDSESVAHDECNALKSNDDDNLT